MTTLPDLKHLIRYAALCLTLLITPSLYSASSPNIVIIFADDLGYGDLQCYNPDSKIPTPNLNKFAKQGIRFTDGHSPATVCTPSRYSLLTGRLSFRTGKRGVFTGTAGPCRIEKSRLTLPGMLQSKGYHTALFGKWHVGMSFFHKETGERIQGGPESIAQTDFSRRIPDGPIDRGFDKFFGTACCPTTDHLYTYIDGDRVTKAPTILMDRKEKDRRGLTLNPYTGDFRAGYATKEFEPQNVDLVFLSKAQDFLKKHHKDSPEKPFFLQLCTQGVHLPSIPADAYRGKSGMGPHGDFIYELDDVSGQLLATLKELGYEKNTLVIFSSDNGPEVPTVNDMVKTYDHYGSHPWRGVKRDNWEGGHRVPFMVRWPGMAPAGMVSDQLISLTDVLATVASIIDYDLPDTAGEDSFDMLAAFKGAKEPIRTWSLQEATRGKSLRKGKWKYMDHQGSGGNNYKREGAWGAGAFAFKAKEVDAPGQLYNLEEDPREVNNLYLEQADLVRELSEKMAEFIDAGRSAPSRK